jgi:hypothetical protein
MKLSVSSLFWQHGVHDEFYQKLNSLNVKYLEIAPKKTFNEFQLKLIRKERSLNKLISFFCFNILH